MKRNGIKKVKVVRWFFKAYDALQSQWISEDTKKEATTEEKLQEKSTKLKEALKVFEEVNLNKIFSNLQEITSNIEPRIDHIETSIQK